MWPNSQTLLPAAFAASGTVVLAFRPHSIEPSGRGFLYGYDVDTVDADGIADTVLSYIDTDPLAVAAAENADGLVVVDPETGLRALVWVYPADPALPALASATYPQRVVELLGAVGVPIEEPSLSVSAYRPGKRAVIRVETRESTLFLKVVRPARAEPIARQHAAFAAEGLPVPEVVAVRPEGLLVLASAQGVPAGTKIREIAETSDFVDSLLQLGTVVASVHLDQRAQPDALDNAAWHRTSLVSSLPEHETRITGLYDEIEIRRASWPEGELQVVHGDLHLEQIFVDPVAPGRITGILDIDTAGLGHPARDVGAVVAHLVVTAQWHRGNADLLEAGACDRLADRLVDAWTRANPFLADRLAPTVASQLLAHAGGQASLSTPIGECKAIQLLDAAEGALRLT